MDVFTYRDGVTVATYPLHQTPIGAAHLVRVYRGPDLVFRGVTNTQAAARLLGSTVRQKLTVEKAA